MIIQASGLAMAIGKQVIEGRPIVWEPGDMDALYDHLSPCRALIGEKFILSGELPDWVALTVVRALQPESVAIDDPTFGLVDIPELRPQESYSDHLNWIFSTQTRGFTLIQFGAPADTTFDVRVLPEIIPPTVPTDKAVLLAGIGPPVLLLTLAKAYRKARFVAVYEPASKPTAEPQTPAGYVVCITHSSIKLGTVFPATTVAAALAAHVPRQSC